MQVIDSIDELGEAGALDRLDVLHESERRTQAEVLRLAVQFAVLHDEHTLDPDSRDLDGRERAVAYGGAGTPLVTEFCSARPNGQSGLGNYGADDHLPPPNQDLREMDRQAALPRRLPWRDPHGALYLVDHTGTRRLGRAA
jgi:hypothetical protein